MKALTTAGLTKLIQLIKSSFISNTDTVTTNTVTLATVATSGSYNDLSNQPTIGNGTITFTQGGVTKGTITANQTGNSTIAFDAGGGGGAVDSVNGYTGTVVLTASDVGALPDSTTIPTMTSQLTNDSGFITNSALTNYVTTNTAQDISGRKTFLGEKAIYFKQSATTDKLGFTLYNPSGTELSALEYRPNTISGSALLALNTSYANSCYVGFRYWGTAVNIVAPKVATAGNYYIPTHITDGTNTVTASNNGTINISTLLPTIPTVGNGTITINQGGTQKGTFTVNQSGDTTINLDAGGSGGTVDQTFNGSSANAQSGVAIAGAGFLQNAAGASGALAILGTTSYNYAIALGEYANANDNSAIAMGYYAYANYPQTIALGIQAQATAAGTVAIGGNATATAARAHAFGYLSEASASGATALGYEAKATASGALQIGTGTNNTANTLQVSSYTLLDTSTGLIPDARISSNIARTSQIPSITVDQTFDGTSANAQSGVAIAGAGFITGITSSDVTNALGYTPYNSTNPNSYLSSSDFKTINNTSIVGSGNIDTSEIFVATYGTTTYAEIMAAYNAGKTVLLSTDNSIGVPQGSAFIFNSCYEKSVLKTICDSSTGWGGASYYLADTDLSNISSTGQKVIDGQWVGTNQSIISSATSLTGSTNLTYRVDLPNDGHKYEVMLRGNIYTGNTAGNDVSLTLNGNQDSTSRYVCRANGAVAGTWIARGTVICVMSYVASSEKNLTISRASNWVGYCNELAAIAYRRIGTNT